MGRDITQLWSWKHIVWVDLYQCCICIDSIMGKTRLEKHVEQLSYYKGEDR